MEQVKKEQCIESGVASAPEQFCQEIEKAVEMDFHLTKIAKALNKYYEYLRATKRHQKNKYPVVDGLKCVRGVYRVAYKMNKDHIIKHL